MEIFNENDNSDSNNNIKEEDIQNDLPSVEIDEDKEEEEKPILFDLNKSITTSEETSSNDNSINESIFQNDSSSIIPIENSADSTEFKNDSNNNINKNEDNIMNASELNYFRYIIEAPSSSSSLIKNDEKEFKSSTESLNDSNENDLNNNNNNNNDDDKKSISSTVIDNKSNDLNEDLEKSSFTSANSSFNNDDSPLRYSSKRSSPLNKIEKSQTKKPWYSAFTNTYKQKNFDFKKLFKLKQEEHLLVDYSCALQREILAHGRLYISLNYVCFRANIIGWETTLVIKLKEIRTILKDKTAKIIPNAITIVTDNERYFFTSFAARDKTYTTLFRVWQIALADASMSQEEIINILKTSYGEDLGYNSEDADFEYYSKLKSKETSLLSPATELNNSENNNTDSLSSSPVLPKGLNYLSAAYNYNDILSRVNLGHRQSSSYDTSLIDTSERPRSMVVNKNHPTTASMTSPSSPSAGTLPKNQSASVLISNTNNNNNNNNLTSNNETNGFNFSTSYDINQKQNLNSINSETNDDSNNQENNLQNISENQTPIKTENSTGIKNSPDKIALSSSVNIFSTSSPIQNIPPSDLSSSSTSSSSENNNNSDDQQEVDYSIKCSCQEHNGKEMLNIVFNLSVNYLWESLFGHTEFCRKYWETRKFHNFKITEWKPVNTFVMRQLEYIVDLGTIGRPKNTEDQKILEYRPNLCIVLESESSTHGVPYSDCFTVRNRFCLTRITSSSTRLCITSFLNYIQKPNFIAKGFIERNTMGALKDSYNYLANLVEKEYVNSNKLCHEFMFTKQITECLLTISINTSNDGVTINKNSSFKKNNLSKQESSTTLLSYFNNEVLREKNLPKLVQPSGIPEQISAVTSTTRASLLNKNNVKKANGNALTNSISNNNKNDEIINNSNSINNSNRSSTNSSKYPGLSTVKKKLKRNFIPLNEANNNINVNNESLNQTPISNQLIQPQLVPIQKFSFFRWEINVDTLVRLFIVAMICLMVINAMLYYKLRRIETLADGLRNDPNILAKITSQQAIQKNYENRLNENSFINDLHGWKDVISNTLGIIEKMENSLKEWDKSIERRPPGKDLNEIIDELKTGKKEL